MSGKYTLQFEADGAVLVTGATGFVGSHLCSALRDDGYFVRAATRTVSDRQDAVKIGDICEDTDWSDALDKMKYVVHLAARVHIMQDKAADPLAAFRAINVAGTARLARAAAQAGVRRFIYVSSIKVNGEKTGTSGPYFSEQNMPQPLDPYGVSKWEAEQAVMQISAETGMEYTIVRPPLIYGAHVKGNFLTMLGWLNRGIPLPLGSINNRRSLIGIGNFVNFLMVCLKHPNAANELFLVSDDEDLSTPDLIRRLGQALGSHPLLLPCPDLLLRLPARILGKEEVVNRLVDSLQIDIRKAKDLLHWQPPVSVDEGLRETARWYHQRVNDNPAR
jgi:nucleoside-diphosphate-sugar epimerase